MFLLADCAYPTIRGVIEENGRGRDLEEGTVTLISAWNNKKKQCEYKDLNKGPDAFEDMHLFPNKPAVRALLFTEQGFYKL